jgi:DNA-binding CsgD family transcriptional regulator
LRARIVLMAADGVANQLIAERLGTSRPSVLKWRARFQDGGMNGPEEAEGRGPKPTYGQDFVEAVGDNPDRLRSEASFAHLCGVAPLPASSGKTTGRHRLNRGGNRQANNALWRIVIGRLRWHQPTKDYVARRTAEGLSKKEIIR